MSNSHYSYMDSESNSSSGKPHPIPRGGEPTDKDQVQSPHEAITDNQISGAHEPAFKDQVQSRHEAITDNEIRGAQGPDF